MRHHLSHDPLRARLALLLRAVPFLPGLLPPAAADSGSVWATPHDSYSSSVGVLGCKINTNRVAYWPSSVSCTSICVSLSYAGRSVYLLKIDQSGGAHDVSYDAWNYLVTGSPATEAPTAGGAVAMDYEDVDASHCADLITGPGTDGRLPLSASNSMDFLASCLEEDGSWVGGNHVLYNILDPICTWGYDEECKLDWPTANQPTCAHTLGMPVALTTDPVYNVLYPSGNTALASSGTVVANASNPTSTTPGSGKSGASGGRTLEGITVLVMVVNIVYCLLQLI